MALDWDICVPISAPNYIVNPSFEVGGTTGWAGFNCAAGTSSAQARRGLLSLAGTPTSNGSAGMYYAVALTQGSTYYFSCDFYGQSGIPYKVAFTDTSNNPVGTTATFSGTAYWQATRPEASYTAASSTTYRLNVSKNSSADTGVFYIDGAMLTTIPNCTYIDGWEHPGCSWDGAVHASTSQRDGQSRDGGQMVDLSTYGFTVQELQGVGMPEQENVIIPYGLLDGGYYQRSKARPRVFQLVGLFNTDSNPTLNQLHTYRKAFEDAIKYDLTDTPQTFWLRYAGGNKRAMWIKCVYQGGMDMKFGEISNREKVAAQFIAPDPLFYEEGTCAASLGYSQNVTGANYILQRSKTGVWGALSTGASGDVRALITGQDNSLYAGGAFGSINGVANTSRIAKWNGAAWSALGNGWNGTVEALALDAAGNLYAAGQGSAVGVANTNRIAKWNGTSWSALGTGANNDIYALCFDNSGNLYAAGAFTAIGGVSSKGIAKWNGAAWSALGTAGFTAGLGEGYALAFSKWGNLIVGGNFAAVNGVTAYGIAKWNGSTWSALGSVGPAGKCYALAVGRDGALYAGGDFAIADSGTVESIARWNGKTWQALSSGVSDSVWALDTGPDGLLYLGGDFTTAGGVSVPDHIATWTGSQYIPLGVNLPGTAITYAIDYTDRGVLTVGFDTAGTATSSVVTTTNNSSTKSYPIIRFDGPGTIWNVKNFTTGKQISFNNLFLQAGETAVLNLTPGNIQFYSMWRGDLMHTIAPGSNLANFSLLPGVNSVSAFIYGGTAATTTAYMKWRNTYWNIDGGAN